MKYILASMSPRRKQLLSKIVDDFLVVPSLADENLINYYTESEILEKLTNCPMEICMKLGEVKALSVSKDYEDAIVIGSDTGVFFQGEMLGKPTDTDNAIAMLKKLSDSTHQVITGVAIVEKRAGKTTIHRDYVVTEVEFNKLTDKEILDYVETLSPMDKAGAYGIQDKTNLVKGIVGDYENVMGFPTFKIKEMIENIRSNYGNS